jgi:hypothetical protein
MFTFIHKKYSAGHVVHTGLQHSEQTVPIELEHSEQTVPIELEHSEQSVTIELYNSEIAIPLHSAHAVATAVYIPQ